MSSRAAHSKSSIERIAAEQEPVNLRAYDNSVVTLNSPLNDLDLDQILRDKQKNIKRIYQAADFYTDADPIVYGIIKHVYVPFTTSEWYLTCPNKKTIDIFEEHYQKIRLKELMEDIFYQYYKYGNVFVYIWNGMPMTLPPHKCEIANVQIDGTPIVDFNVEQIVTEFRQRFYSVRYNSGDFIDDTAEKILEGYPPEVALAIKENKQYARLNPENVFVLQGLKEGWARYAIPWIVAAFYALRKKELIQSYEESLLNIGQRAFVHVRYGDDKIGMDMLPDAVQLTGIRRIFADAMKGNPLATTSHLAQASVVQADMSDLYQFPLYSQVNDDILAAGGIAGIIVNGDSEKGSTFASAQVSVQAVTNRIHAARKEFEDFMQKLNQRLVDDIRLVRTNNLKNIPEFHFVPTDLDGDKKLRETCEKLWTQGLVSTNTYMRTMGYATNVELEKRRQEAEDGTDKILAPRNLTGGTETDQTDENSVGRPKLDDDERHSDPDNAIRSKESKDSADGNFDTTDE